MGIESLQYMRPTEQFLFVERKPVEGKCPRCGSTDIRKYPVFHNGYPWIATKCQNCLYHLRLEESKPGDKWPPFRSAAYDWPASPAEGGKAPRK